ncbi:MAG: bacterioferritin-associated ferredoxin [Salinisphaeraceae bacterium]|uniref:Bacterioferritin-associated ferredoxin n=1 Tax=Spongiibacter thalassae TaxID=2721624 RepID=A0ABX1GKB7_9GAMM|nr:bacterioferritin-associated ferredoxin [Spongiibacter thalassae]MDX1498005.1 bacterioferritin-associated ferredoxin [Salinisphaeraceae bacterium]NKI19410.1 (2Fe-2S)-binding protein [Spongiibacter thalassae]
MYVCLCKGITDKHIRDAVDNGAGSFRQVRRDLDLASQCGKCGTLARSIYDEYLKNFDESLCYAAA